MTTTTIITNDRSGNAIGLLAVADTQGRLIPGHALYDTSGIPAGTPTNPVMTLPAATAAISLVSRGTVTVASVSTALVAANPGRRVFRVQAPLGGTLWLNVLGGVAGPGLSDCLMLGPGDLYESSVGNAVTYWCATGGLTIAAMEG